MRYPVGLWGQLTTTTLVFGWRLSLKKLRSSRQLRSGSAYHGVIRHQDRFRWLPPQAGPIAFPKWLGDETVEDFCRDLLEKTGVLLLPGTLYQGDFQHFRIGFGRENLAECIDRFEAYLDKR